MPIYFRYVFFIIFISEKRLLEIKHIGMIETAVVIGLLFHFVLFPLAFRWSEHRL